MESIMRTTTQLLPHYRGLLFKRTEYVVRFTIEFPEEEKAIIKQCKISYTLYHERGRLLRGSNQQIPIGLGNALKNMPYEPAFKTRVEAKAFERELTEQILPDLKDTIAASKARDN